MCSVVIVIGFCYLDNQNLMFVTFIADCNFVLHFFSADFSATITVGIVYMPVFFFYIPNYNIIYYYNLT